MLGGIGYIYYGLGDKHRALENYDQALSLFEATKDDWGVAEARMDIGRIYHSFGEEDKALASFHQALALFKQLSMPRLEAQTLRDIGLLYSFSGDQPRALTLYQQALQLTRLGQDQRDEAYTLNYIGHAYETSGAKLLARTYYQRALPLSRAAADPSGESLTLYNLAHVAENLGNFEDARRQIEAAVKISEGLRTKISSQDMRASYLATVRQHYELYIDVLMQLRKQHPAQAYDAAAFNISEKAHARSLLESLQEARADIRQGVDPGLLDHERSLLQALNAKAERHMHLLAARDEEQAKTAGSFFIDNHYGTPTLQQVNDPKFGKFYRLTVVVRAPATEHVVCSISGLMACIGAIFAIEYVGWGSLVQNGGGAGCTK